MKSLGEIYWDIDHECLHSDKTISFSDETMMLFHAAEEYVEELRKHDDRWKSIVLHDIDYLKASSFIRREQKGYSEGAEIFLGFIYHELERYGFKIDDGDISSVKETNQPKTILETGDNIDVIDEDGEDESSDDVDDEISLPLAMDTEKARCIFTAAYNEQWMNGNNTIGYTWIGFGNIHQRTGRTVSCTNKLAYLCHKIYEPSTPPWREIGYFFNLERLDRDWSNIKDLIADVKRPSWMNTIDHLIRNYRY